MKHGEMIKRWREAKGMSQLELAVAIGLKEPQFISNIERGVSTIPAVRLGQICRALGTTGAGLQMLNELSRIKHQKAVRKFEGES